MNYFKKLVLVISFITISSGLNAAEIKMAKANWDTGYFQAEIYKRGLEKLGYKVKDPQAIKPSVFYLAAAQGDLDLWVNGSMAETPADNVMNSLLLMRDTAFCNPLIIKGARENSRILP